MREYHARPDNRERHNAQSRARRNDPVARSQDEVVALQRKYGLTEQQAQVALISRDGGLCDSCREFKKLVVDHDHLTGKARGLICQRCNTIAGSLEDPRRILVHDYLDRSKL